MPFEYIIFIILLAAWAALTYKNLRIAVLLIPLFFPLYLLEINIFGIPVYFVEALIIICAIPVFFFLFIGHSEVLSKSFFKKIFLVIKHKIAPSKWEFKSFIKSPFLPIVLFLAASLISAFIVIGDDAQHAMGILKSWIIIPLIYFYILYRTIKDSEDASFALYAYLASAMILGLWGLYQAASGNYITIDSRVSGPFESANYLAMYITPAFIFASVRFLQTFLHLKLANANKRFVAFEKRVFLGLFAAFLFAVLVLSQSYGALLGAFFAIFVYVIYVRVKTTEFLVKKFLNRIIVFIILFVTLGGALSASLNIEKFQNLIKFDEHTSVATRIEIWEVGLNFIKENPVLGIGLGQYEPNYIYKAESILGHEPLEPVRLHSHNLYLETWLNTGLLGLVSFIWIVVFAFSKYRKIKSGEKKELGIAVIIMLSYILIHGLIDVTYWKNDLSLIFWLIMGVNFSLSKDE
jgi:O-antigen ligase